MEIYDLIEALGTWTWWVVAAFLLVLELLVPGFYFLWLAFSAAVVGAVSLLIEWPWEAQVATFSVVSVVSLIASRMFLKKRPIESDRPFLNRRADRLVGQDMVLAEPIVNGEGRVRVADIIWQVKGPDLAGGTRIVVRDVLDGVLVVEAAEPD